jgi:hypothetical protein
VHTAGESAALVTSQLRLSSAWRVCVNVWRTSIVEGRKIVSADDERKRAATVVRVQCHGSECVMNSREFLRVSDDAINTTCARKLSTVRLCYVSTRIHTNASSPSVGRSRCVGRSNVGNGQVGCRCHVGGVVKLLRAAIRTCAECERQFQHLAHYPPLTSAPPPPSLTTPPTRTFFSRSAWSSDLTSAKR